MRHKLLLAATLGVALSSVGFASAQAPGTNLGAPQTQPQPGGGVNAGRGAPTSALDSAGTRRRQTERQAPRRRDQAAESRRGVEPAGAGGRVQDRGPPPAGGAGAATGGDPSSGQLGLNGAIRPGTSSPTGTGGSSR